MKTVEARTERILEKAKQVKRRRAARAAILSSVSCGLAAILILNLALFLPRGGGAVAEENPGEHGGVIVPGTQEDPPVLSATNDDYSSVAGQIERLAALGRELEKSPAGDWVEQATSNISARLAAARSDGNLLARSGDTLYSLEEVHIGDSWSYRQKFTLRAYASDGSPLSSLTVEPEEGFVFTEVSKYLGIPKTEMAVSPAGDHVYILTTCKGANSVIYTAIIRIGTEDPHTMSVTDVHYISGEYVSVRLIGDMLYVFSDFSVDLDDLSSSRSSAYLPEYGTKNNRFPLPLDDLVLPETGMGASYGVVTSIDASTGEARDALALYAHSSDAYVSEHNIYFTGDLAVTDPSIPDTGYSFYTELVRVPLCADGTLAVVAKSAVKGSAARADFLDETDGTLRLFTSVKIPSVLYPGSSSFSASLWALDAETLTVRAAKEAFGAENESLRAACFDGDLAYLGIGDRIAGFRLGDEIVPLDTNGMSGMYLALAPFGDSLVGIGYTGTRANLKIAVYDRAGGEVASFAELGEYPQNANAYLVDAGCGLVGMGFRHLDRDPGFGDYTVEWAEDADSENETAGSNGAVYLLLRFDGTTLSAVRIPMKGSPEKMRAAFDEATGMLYIVSGSDFKTYKV